MVRVESHNHDEGGNRPTTPPTLGVWDSFPSLPLLYNKASQKSSGVKLLHDLIMLTNPVGQ